MEVLPVVLNSWHTSAATLSMIFTYYHYASRTYEKVTNISAISANLQSETGLMNYHLFEAGSNRLLEIKLPVTAPVYIDEDNTPIA